MMSVGFLFWILMILWLVFGFWQWGMTPLFGGNLLLWVLLALLGWKVFGFPIHG
jgi:hypothetical protein